MSITSKGDAWEAKNSRWIWWTYLPSFGGIGFITAGFRVKKNLWIVGGGSYFAISILLSNIAQQFRGSLIEELFMMPIIVAWFVSIGYAYSIKKEYLLRLEAIENQGGDIYQTIQLKKEIQKEFGGTRPEQNNPIDQSFSSNKGRSSPPPVDRTPEKDYSKPSTPPPVPKSSVNRILLNSASAEEIAKLPGIGIVVAKKAVAIRKQDGQFSSLEDFGVRLSLQPHIVERLRTLVEISIENNNESPSSSFSLNSYAGRPSQKKTNPNSRLIDV
ncbi:hypothetical protein MASR1M12_31450 [Erysipelotrichia bacterium]